MFVLSHDGTRRYTANVEPGTVSVLDVKIRKFITTIPIAQTTQLIFISKDDQTVFTADEAKPRLAYRYNNQSGKEMAATPSHRIRNCGNSGAKSTIGPPCREPGNSPSPARRDTLAKRRLSSRFR